jgi:hypothetical protein
MAEGAAPERDTDAGAADKAAAERTCALTRQPLTPEDGLRFVAGPDANGDYGTTDEWRHFNALYFPYVLGLKPYRRQLNVAEVDTAVLPIIEWFRSQVPERTLYNWQTKAAQLVAQDLRERSRQLLVD